MPCEFVKGVPLSELSDGGGGGDYDPDSSSSDSYPFRETVTVEKNSTHTETATEGERVSNKYIDNRNAGAGTEITASGEDTEVSHIVTGGKNNADGPTISTQVPDDGSGGGSGGGGGTDEPTSTVSDSVLANDTSTKKPPERTGYDEFFDFDSDAVYDRLDYSKINLNSFVSSPAVDGNSMEVVIKAGQHTGSNMNYDLGNFPGATPEEAWAEFDLYFGPNFYVEESGKVGGGFADLGDGGTGGGSLADGTNGWSARMIFFHPESGGDLHLGSYFYHADMSGPYGDGEYWNANGEVSVGKWYRITQYCRMNTPGENNGVYRAWVDGDLAFDKRDLKYRNEGYGDKIRVGNFWIHVYYGGTPTPDHDIAIYYDNMTVSTDRINSSLEPP